MDLAPPGRAAAAATSGSLLRAPLTLVATPTRARPAAAATAVADLFFRLANSGSGWSRGWTSGGRGERPRPMGSPRDRRAVAHSGWGSQACSLSVDGVQRQRHAAPSSFSRMAAGAGGDGARGWTSRRRGERPRRPPRGRCSSPVDPCRYAYAREARGGGDRGRRSPFSFGEFRSRLEPGMDLGRPGRAAATYGVAARSPGCCAQRLGVSGVLSIR